MQEFDTKKLYVFFWNFTRKDIEKLCSIDLSFASNTQENEMISYPQDKFDFIEYLVDDETQKHNCLDIPKKANSNAINVVENFVKSGKKQIILTNYPAFISSLLAQVAYGQLRANEIEIRYDKKQISKYYIRRKQEGNKIEAYFVDENDKKVIFDSSVIPYTNNDPNF